MQSDLAKTLAELSAKATQGEWEVDSEYDHDAAYGSGPDHGTSFLNYFIGNDIDGEWKTLLDTVNSGHKLIDEDYDEDSRHAWDTIGHANTAFIVAIVNAYRTGKLIVVDDGAVERITEAIEAETVARQGRGIYLVTGHSDSKAFATAALAALTKGADHAG